MPSGVGMTNHAFSAKPLVQRNNLRPVRMPSERRGPPLVRLILDRGRGWYDGDPTREPYLADLAGRFRGVREHAMPVERIDMPGRRPLRGRASA